MNPKIDIEISRVQARMDEKITESKGMRLRVE
jgi:hypothetical protein